MTNEPDHSQTRYEVKAIAPGVELIIAIGKQVRRSILDYALGAAILGLLPVYGHGIPTIRLALLIALNLKMGFNVGKFWGNHRGQSILDMLSCLLAIVGSLALGIVVWVGILGISLLIPGIDGLARAAAYGVVTWSIGLAISRYYYNPQTLNLNALQKAIQFYQSHRN